MRVLPGSHHAGQMEHRLHPAKPGSMLRRGQEVQSVDESAALPMALGPGEMSMHHPYTLHCSGRNQSTEARVGVVLVFVTPATKPNTAVGSATLVTGQCNYDHWELSCWRPIPARG